MLSAAVCDDELEVNLEICRLVKKYLPDCETDSYMSGEALLAERKSYDIIFLDVKMKSLNGIKTAEKLRERGCDSVIIFISGLKEYVFSAFDVGAFHYLLKPIDENKLRRVLQKAAETACAEPEKHRLLIKTKDRSLSVNAEDIIYLESDMRKMAAHTLSETLLFYGTMNDLERQLGYGFFRCHRGYLVNMAYVAEYSSSEITLTNGEKVYISKGRYPDFIKSYHRFLRAKGALDEK